MIRTARLVLLVLALAAPLALAAGSLTGPQAAYAQAADDGDGSWVPCESDDPCTDPEDSGETPSECEPDCEEEGDDAFEPTLPAQVTRPGKPVKVKRATVTLAAVCEPEEGCVAATYTLTVKGQRLTATDEALEAGESTKLVFKLTRRQLRKLGGRAVKATVTAPGLPAAQIKLRV